MVTFLVDIENDPFVRKGFDVLNGYCVLAVCHPLELLRCIRGAMESERHPPAINVIVARVGILADQKSALRNSGRPVVIISCDCYKRESHLKSPRIHDFFDSGWKLHPFFVSLFLQSLPKVVLNGVFVRSAPKVVFYIWKKMS